MTRRAKVAEYQASGVVHFHAIFRPDGPNPGDPFAAGASGEVLCEPSIEPPEPLVTGRWEA
jgi:hypothetical protein